MLGPVFQLGEVELPSDVEDLPTDYLAWVVLMAGVFLILHLYAKWLLQRRNVSPAAISEPEPEKSTLLEELETLRQAIPNLSKPQMREALDLSLWLRRSCGEDWSATEEELCAKASEDARPVLRELLHFTTRILFARCLATPEQWVLILDQAQDWMKQHSEERSSV